jgi:hypothetical protein
MRRCRMNPKQQRSSTLESLVLTNWAADERNIGKSPKEVLYELLLLSLLYDKILIQDEIFVLSPRMASWFSTGEYSELLRKCFDLGTLVVLKHPLFAYPTDELKELSLEAPILARAKYIQKFGTRAEYVFEPSAHQFALYHMIDSCLQNRPEAQRPVGYLKKLDIIPTFASILKEVLSSKHYTKWRNAAFRGITDAMAEEFVSFIEEPDRVVTRFRETGRDIVALTGSGDKTIFNRSLAYQAASLYPSRQARAMQRLVQTTFAAPFSWRENAAGSYSGSLRELLWIPAGSPTELGEPERQEEIVSIEAYADVSTALPDLGSDFVKAIVRVCNSEAGMKLRRSIRQLGQDIDFRSQKDAWLEVADELAKAVIQPKPFKIRTAVIRIGEKMVLGSVAGLFDVIRGEKINIPTVLAGAFFSGALGIAFDHGYEVLRNDLGRQKIRRQLERAVEFRCTSLAMPPLVNEQISPLP